MLFLSQHHSLENSVKTVPELLQKIPISKYKTNYQRLLEIFETIVTITMVQYINIVSKVFASSISLYRESFLMSDATY